MYDYFRGIPSDKRKTSRGAFVTLDVNGVGYIFEMTENDFSECKINENTPVKYYVSLIHKEDSMSLYGFSTKETRDIFQILLSVSGVGAKMAIALLNEFDACDLISLVIDGNFKELTRAKGVGPKLAQKIILELKDKLMKTDMPKIPVNFTNNQAVSDTQAVMLSLGYETSEIEDAISKVLPMVDNKENPEEILRKALTWASSVNR